MKVERIHQLQSQTTRYVKGSSSGKRKTIPDGNMNLHKGMKKLRNSKYASIVFLFLKPL